MDLQSRRRRSNPEGAQAPDGAEPLLALPDVTTAPGAVPVGENQAGRADTNPFWSERARAEQELHALRPRILDEAAGRQISPARRVVQLSYDPAVLEWMGWLRDWVCKGKLDK